MPELERVTVEAQCACGRKTRRYVIVAADGSRDYPKPYRKCHVCAEQWWRLGLGDKHHDDPGKHKKPGAQKTPGRRFKVTPAVLDSMRKLQSAGLTNEAIGTELSLSTKTVWRHLKFPLGRYRATLH